MADRPCMVVVGTGVATGVPDQCILHIALNATANTPAEALALCSDAADRVVSALGREGVEPSETRTTNLSIQDFHDRATMQVTARVGSYQMEVIVRPLEDVGRVAAVLSAEAGDALQIQSLHLAVSNPGPHEQEARRLAVLNAQSKASELAHAANVTLGAILSIEDQIGRISHPMAARAMSTGVGVTASLPVEAGAVTTSCSVIVTYAIQD
jgi:uncharacterized protein